MEYFYTNNVDLCKKIDDFFSSIEKANKEQFDGKISIILLGSLSRGEGTWKMVGDYPILLSDIEFLTIFENGFKRFSEYENLLAKSKTKFFANQSSELFKIDNSYVKNNKLSKMEKKLLIYDAKIFGKTMVGSNYLELLPDVTIDNINLNDIYEILVHRLFSVLYYGNKLRKYLLTMHKNMICSHHRHTLGR